jgi:hypothetical protein
MKKPIEITAIDIDETEKAFKGDGSIVTDGTAYYRLDLGMKQFFDRVLVKHDIVGFKFEEGSFNFGVIVRKKNGTANLEAECRKRGISF